VGSKYSLDVGRIGLIDPTAKGYDRVSHEVTV
jgi:hypothetical protein